MKRVFYILPAILLLCVAIGFSGCEKYDSHYDAVGFVHSNDSDSAEMSFWKFEGTMVFRLKNRDGGSLRCTGTVETGAITVFYDDGGQKTQLVTLASGETVDHTLPSAKAGIVFVIVETDGPCANGSLNFTIEQ